MTASHHRILQRYLSNHMESRASRRSAVGLPTDKHYQQSVVVPVFNESADCLGRVFQYLEHTDTLVIAVVNAPADANEKTQVQTRGLLQQVHRHTRLDVLVIDAVSIPLNPKAGVGLARKIGTDTALALYAGGRITSPWIYQTDADAVLPAEYFSAALPPSGAVVFAHTHHSDDPQLQHAANLYDLHMAYYTAGLTAAGSRFAYPTLGSTIAVHAHTYAAVRGYPKRNAAEDFYLLNKAAKVHGVQYRAEIVIQLEARLSDRVPFGTGPALVDIIAGLQLDPQGMFYLSYHPASFSLLRQALVYLEDFAEAPEKARKRHGSKYPQRQALESIFNTLRFDRVENPFINRYTKPSQRRRVVHEWFDAGKTLRFIHEARKYYPDQPLLMTLKTLPEWIAAHLNTFVVS